MISAIVKKHEWCYSIEQDLFLYVVSNKKHTKDRGVATMNTEKCTSWVERDKKVIAPTQHLSYFPLVVESGKDSIIRDLDGNEYIDFLSSASSLNLGTCNDHVKAAVQEQLKKYSQYTIAYTYNIPAIEYAERLVSTYPGGVKAKILFGNCGSDGNDAAVKFARAFTGRTKIITFINGYHGNTYGSSSMTTVTTRMRKKMGPFLPEIYPFPFFGSDTPDDVCEKECLKEMQRAFDTYLPADDVAAVIIEPVQGDGGLIPAHPIFMKKLYELCQKHGILFISEEVQQAFYRTGKMYGIEHYDIVPDGIILGKSVGAGLTLGAFMARDEIMDCLPAPAHLFTLGGNALACSAGIAAFDYMQTEEFQNILKTNGDILQESFAMLKEKHGDIISTTNGLGMSCGIGIVKTNADGTKEPDLDGTFKILYRAYEKGLLVISVAGNILRIQPPLNIDHDLFRKAFAILDEAMADYEAGNIPDDVLQFQNGW